MNQRHLFKIIMSYILCVVLFACDKPDDIIVIETPEPLHAGEIRIKAYPDEDNKISFIVVSKKITIDWGDDTTEEFTPDGMPEAFVHEYTDQQPKHIIIHTEEMNAFGAFSMVRMNNVFIHTFGLLEEIIFGKCPHLEEVILRGNALTRLETEEADSLTLLDCSYNLLSASSLNSLFTSLPSTEEGTILFFLNPGSETCDINIALSKGWTVRQPDEISVIEAEDEVLINASTRIFSAFENLLKPIKGIMQKH